MKKVFTTLLLLTCLFSSISTFAKSPKGITVTVKGLENKQAILAYYYENSKFIADTLQFNAAATLTITPTEKYADGVYLLAFPDLNYTYFDFILKEHQFSLSTDTTNLVANMQIKGSKENELMYKDLHFMMPIGKENATLNQSLKNLNPNTQEYKVLKQKLDSNNIHIQDFRTQLANQYAGTLYSSLLNIMTAPKIPKEQLDENRNWKDTSITLNYIKNHYFDVIDFKDSAYVRTPIYKSYLTKYFDMYANPNPDSLIVEIDKLIEKTKANNLLYQYSLNTIFDKYAKSEIMGYDKIYVYLSDNYYLNGKAWWSDKESLDKLKKYVDEIRPTLIGNTAPNFIFRDSLLNPYNFYSLLNQNSYTLLIFWDSDCGHCKEEIPEIKSAYDSLKTLGLQIVSIAIDTDEKNFKAFAAKNCHTEWITGWDPYVQSAFRREYNTSSTPKLYLINNNTKQIKAKNLKVADLYGYINYLIKTDSNKN